MSTSEIETVRAGAVMEGDRLPDGLGTVILRLNDGGTLIYETSTGAAFSKDMHAIMQRFVREADGKYGLAWERAEAEARALDSHGSAA